MNEPRSGGISGETLSGLHARVRAYLSARARRVVVTWAAVAASATLLLAWVVAGPDGWRPGSAAPLVLDAVLLSLVVAAAVAGRRWFRRRLSEPALARSMEASAGLPDGLVRSSLELSRTRPEGVSPALIRRGEEGLLTRLTPDAATLGGRAALEVRTGMRRGVGALAVLAPLLVILLVTMPERTTAAWRGLASPIALLTEPALPPLAVEPGSIEVPRGSPLTVHVRAEGRDAVVVHWQAAGDVERSAEVAVRDAGASHAFPEVRAALRYWVSAPDGARSDVFEVTPLDDLYLTDVSVRLVFPPYVARVDEEYRGEIPVLEVPLGTRIEFLGNGSRALGGVRLVEADGTRAVDLEVGGTGFEGGFTPRQGGRFDWQVTDREGNPAALVPAPVDIVVVPDQAPQVAIRDPGRDTVLPLDLRQTLVIEAADDHGLDHLELVAWRITALGEAQTPVRQRIDAGGLPGVLARPVLDLSAWQLLPGDRVRYFARVEDNGRPAQEAASAEFELRMPDAAALRRDAQEALDRSADELAELTRRAREGAENARAMERQAAAPERDASQQRFRPDAQGGELDFEAREDLRRALDEQERMAAQVDSLRQRLGDLSDAMQQAGVRDPELGADLRELQSLLDEVSTPELRERLDELSRQLDEMDRTRARDALGEMAEQEEAFRERLEEALDRMRRAAAQQDFRTTAREAQELADREQALAEAMTTETSPEALDQRAAQQEELRDEAQAMQERLEQLGARLDELGETDAARGVDQAGEQAEASLEAMRRAMEAARNQDGARAGQQAGQASEGLSEAARALQDAQQQMMQERVEALQRALEQTAQDALTLARRQGELREEMRGASAERLGEMRGDVSALEQGLRSMAENLSIASRAAGVPGAEREVGGALGQAMAAVEQSLQSLDAPSAPGSTPGTAADRAVEALNQLALQTMAVSSRMSEGAQGAGTPEQMMEALERLAQQQADVNNQASQMMPMELGAEAMQQQMQQMAQGQQSVASELGEMSNQEGDGPLGNLEALAGEAEALARAGEQGRLEPEVRQRQERLFHRRLDAGRSLEKEEFSDEREGAAPGAFERSLVAPVGTDALGLSRFRQPDAAALARLPPASRALVIRYFRRLNEGGSPPGAGR